jgi:hypothetical protein
MLDDQIVHQRDDCMPDGPAAKCDAAKQPTTRSCGTACDRSLICDWECVASIEMNRGSSRVEGSAFVALAQITLSQAFSLLILLL